MDERTTNKYKTVAKDNDTLYLIYKVCLLLFIIFLIYLIKKFIL
jgi:flagellar biogenesis protein FliO